MTSASESTTPVPVTLPATARPAPTLTQQNRLALLMHDNLVGGSGKMGMGILRYGEMPIAAVIDRQNAGGDLFTLTGIARSVPIVASVEEAIQQGANTLVPGVANIGGVLPPEWWQEIKIGLRGGMSLVNGLHAPLAEHPELLPLIGPGQFVWDVRREPPGLTNGMGRALNVSARRVLMVGTDMSIGKMTVAIEADREARRRGLKSKFLASGQTGICIAGAGVALDAVRVDFASGVVEQLVLKYGDTHDWLFVEGQGSVLHPASTAWLPLIRGSCPTHLILCHRFGQESVSRAEWVKIPPLREVAALYEAVCAAGGAFPAARVIGLALHCPNMTDAEAHQVLNAITAETGLPATDVVRFGAGVLLDALLASEK